MINLSPGQTWLFHIFQLRCAKKQFEKFVPSPDDAGEDGGHIRAARTPITRPSPLPAVFLPHGAERCHVSTPLFTLLSATHSACLKSGFPSSPALEMVTQAGTLYKPHSLCWVGSLVVRKRRFRGGRRQVKVRTSICTQGDTNAETSASPLATPSQRPLLPRGHLRPFVRV